MGPPTLSPPQMGALGLDSTARIQGAATGAALRDLGINVDFAPVVDVAGVDGLVHVPRAGGPGRSTRRGRQWLANAFAQGLRWRGVLPTLKHFPGIGFATQNTDTSVVTDHCARGRRSRPASCPTGWP